MPMVMVVVSVMYAERLKAYRAAVERVIRNEKDGLITKEQADKDVETWRRVYNVHESHAIERNVNGFSGVIA